MTIAIIGAGIAGAACSSALIRSNKSVVLFDKARAVGGRMSSKRCGGYYADLGAQYFTARSEAFIAQCQQWLAQGAIASWQPRIATLYDSLIPSPDTTKRFIGVPSMQKPIQQLLRDCDVKTQCHVDRVHYAQGRWQLYCASELLGSFDTLVLAMPQQQAKTLLQQYSNDIPMWAEIFDLPALLPCWAASISLSAPVNSSFDAVFVRSHAAISWLARQSTKPGRGEQESWVVHFSPVFSKSHLNASEEFIAQIAVSELQKVLDQPLQVKSLLCHRWRYAVLSEQYQSRGAVWLPGVNLGLCGDWLAGGRVENAWMSGQQLAEAILA